MLNPQDKLFKDIGEADYDDMKYHELQDEIAMGFKEKDEL
tara:strand:+ start:198 stop:317 length:120 start_codon:yes stop_codon:yes gene_type:complete